MSEARKTHWSLRALLPLGVCVAAILAFSKGPIAEVSEIDAFQLAVSTQTKADAQAFIKDFGSSHLVPDLIDLLEPGVAVEVCASLSGGSSRARAVCDKVKQAIAVAPAAGSPTPTAPVAITPTPPAPVVVTATPPAQAAVIPTPPAPTEETAPVASSFAVAPPAEDATAVPLVEQDSGVAIAAGMSSPVKGVAETLRKLTARFVQGPFAVDYLDRERGEMVVTYKGDMGRFVACGDSIGVAQSSSQTAGAAGNSADRLNSRMILRLADGNSGSTSISVDAIHIVALSRPASGSLDVVDVRLGKPARTSDGRYCWSTGEMERLARLQ